MSITPDTQAILLLTAHFSKPKTDAVKPLAPKEWGRFAAWLKENRLTPEKIMTGELTGLLREWEDKTVTPPATCCILPIPPGDRGGRIRKPRNVWVRPNGVAGSD